MGFSLFLEELCYVISGKGYILIATLLAIRLLSEYFLCNLYLHIIIQFFGYLQYMLITRVMQIIYVYMQVYTNKMVLL